MKEEEKKGSGAGTRAYRRRKLKTVKNEKERRKSGKRELMGW